MGSDPLGSSYLVKRLSAASASIGSAAGSGDGVGVGGSAGLSTRGSLTPSRAPAVKKVIMMCGLIDYVLHRTVSVTQARKRPRVRVDKA